MTTAERRAHSFRHACFGLGLVVITACGGSDPLDPGQGGAGPSAPNEVTITLFHTNDEHGWLQPDDVTDPAFVRGGAANAASALRAAGFDPASNALVSSGDNWTGPDVSTWVEGESAVEVFNAMGYLASAVGNHEFDFGPEVLAQRAEEANYAHVSANLTETTTGETPSFAKPYVLYEQQGVTVAFVGLTTQGTTTSGHPRFVDDFTFGDPVAALERIVPKARDEGADIIVVLAHECHTDLVPLALEADVELDLVLAGHCHAVADFEVEGVPFVTSGAHFGGFSRIDMAFDRSTGDVVSTTASYTEVSYPRGEANPMVPDPEVAAIVASWQEHVDAELDVNIGFAGEAIEVGSWSLANWVVDAWLAEYPSADLALVNFGSLRQTVNEGAITLGEMVGVMPFKNELVQVELTGAELVAAVAHGTSGEPLSGRYPAVGGFTYAGAGDDVVVSLMAGTYAPDATYTVLITDYLYWGGAGYAFQSYDDTPTLLDEHMRTPVVRWTEDLMTTGTEPLGSQIDAAPRNE